MLVRCALSDPSFPHDVETDLAYRKVVGWEQRRAAGGLHSLTLREVLDEYACYACIQRYRQNIAVTQIDLFEPSTDRAGSGGE